MSDCRFGVSPVNYPDPDPDPFYFSDLFYFRTVLAGYGHVIFSWAQIGRSAIFGSEIVVPDREIFLRWGIKATAGPCRRA